jgi:hypothetical protein
MDSISFTEGIEEDNFIYQRETAAVHTSRHETVVASKESRRFNLASSFPSFEFRGKCSGNNFGKCLSFAGNIIKSANYQTRQTERGRLSIRKLYKKFVAKFDFANGKSHFSRKSERMAATRAIDMETAKKPWLISMLFGFISDFIETCHRNGSIVRFYQKISMASWNFLRLYVRYDRKFLTIENCL